ncbi:hypothetical protein Psyaliredsea_09500 [Psychrobacter alimentarius]
MYDVAKSHLDTDLPFMQTIPQDTKNADNPLLESATISPQQALEQQDARTDRNFDAIADHFEKKSTVV